MVDVRLVGLAIGQSLAWWVYCTRFGRAGQRQRVLEAEPLRLSSSRTCAAALWCRRIPASPRRAREVGADVLAGAAQEPRGVCPSAFSFKHTGLWIGQLGEEGLESEDGDVLAAAGCTRPAWDAAPCCSALDYSLAGGAGSSAPPPSPPSRPPTAELSPPPPPARAPARGAPCRHRGRRAHRRRSRWRARRAGAVAVSAVGQRGGGAEPRAHGVRRVHESLSETSTLT